MADPGQSSWLRRYFGYEHNPRRRRLVQQASTLFMAGIFLSGLVAALLGPLGAVAWVPGMAAVAGVLIVGVAKVVQAAREPHHDAPQKE